MDSISILTKLCVTILLLFETINLYLLKILFEKENILELFSHQAGFFFQSLFHQVKELGLTVEEVDKLTGPVIGRPKSATFRTVDVVGLDTLVHVANGIYEKLTISRLHQ